MARSGRGLGGEGYDSSALAFEEATQLLRTRRVTQLAQGLGLDLPDALARDVELLADFFERVIGVHLDAEAHAQHLCLARGERVEHVLAYIAQARIHRVVDRSDRARILDEVPEMRVVVVADRRLHGDRLLADLQDLADLLFR